jgi:hypothetical protein
MLLLSAPFSPLFDSQESLSWVALRCKSDLTTLASSGPERIPINTSQDIVAISLHVKNAAPTNDKAAIRATPGGDQGTRCKQHEYDSRQLHRACSPNRRSFSELELHGDSSKGPEYRHIGPPVRSQLASSAHGTLQHDRRAHRLHRKHHQPYRPSSSLQL